MGKLLRSSIATHREWFEINQQQLSGFEALLQQGDNDLYNWITGKAPVPAAHDLDLMAWLKKFNNAP